MEFNYENMRHLEGQMIRYKNESGDWSFGKVVKVEKDGIKISELSTSNPDEGFGFGFFPGPFFRRPFFIPFGVPFFPFFFF